MRLGGLVGAAIAAAASIAAAPTASASAVTYCNQVGGQWNGASCHASVLSERKAVREIDIAVPAEIDNPVIGGAITDYLTTLMNNWRSVGMHMNHDSWGIASFEVFHHGNIHTVVFHEDYHQEGTAANNAFRTFAFNSATGQQVQLADLVDVNAIPALGAPFIQTALDQAAPPPSVFSQAAPQALASSRTRRM